MAKPGTHRDRKTARVAGDDHTGQRASHLRAVDSTQTQTEALADSPSATDEERFKWALDRAKEGHAVSMANVADFYRDGIGVEQDDYAAFDWYFKAAEKGLARAQYELAQMYRFTTIPQPKEKNYLYWITLAAHQEHPESQYLLGDECKYNHELDDALNWYKRAAKNGSADAAYELGKLYFEGFRRISCDKAGGLRWYQRAAELGSASACYFIATLHEQGEEVPQNYTEAVIWYKKAADGEEYGALVSIGNLYETRKDGQHDYAEAMHWYRQGVEKGDTSGLLRIGELYEQGKGVTQNYAEAARLYRLVSEKGNSDGFHALAALKAKLGAAFREKDSPTENTVEIVQEERQNKIDFNSELQPSSGKDLYEIPLPEPQLLLLKKPALEDSVAELLAVSGVAEEVRPALARTFVQLIEEAQRDPAALEARLAAMMDAPVAAAPAVPPPPDKAPELYRHRPRDSKTGRQESVDKFMAHAYAPWIVDGELMIPRETIRELDPECDFAITRWRGNHKGEEFPIKMRKDEADLTLTPEQIRAAQRLAQRAYRERKSANQGR